MIRPVHDGRAPGSDPVLDVRDLVVHRDPAVPRPLDAGPARADSRRELPRRTLDVDDRVRLDVHRRERLRVSPWSEALLERRRGRDEDHLILGEAPAVVDGPCAGIRREHLELQVLELRSKIADEAQSEMSKEQREYLLRQQLRAIQKELGGGNPEQTEIALLRERFAKADLPEEARKEAERELARLEPLPNSAPDYHVARTYLELLF